MTQSSPKVLTGDRAARKREAIIAAARTAFVRDGFDAAVDAIAAAAGVSKVTVYNHYGNKETLFKAVIGDALEGALADVISGTAQRLAESRDLRAALKWTATEWVTSMTEPDLVALRHLVTNEVRRFPELGNAWREHGPDRAAPALAAAFERLIADDRLTMPDIDTAIVQLYALVLYPHLVHSTYGATVDPHTTSRLIDTGVDMFLQYYAYQD
ncbi:TetR/AcrR family transcriptional regulator [Kribbella antibiotica]|uniref:TetR/AcrR family transcriptional regulator n=1 Tax=Kribbella antibiotica TaxID=190195 RepID=A0A4R4Z8G0_9ACTN|nr:TetR/AcrR family transcriptional regulator C-terminal domain-containing protein [Kribbella antibiotica]TDD54483.1 TetR/AcrR family transcriptional regulator [Kribbella antibiotica]